MELKFKCWNYWMKEWVFFDNMEIVLDKSICPRIHLYFRSKKSVVNTFRNEDVFQFTGLKDKNGVELYFDSDIVRLGNVEGEFYAMRHAHHGTPYFVEVDGNAYVAFSYFFEKYEEEFEIVGSIQDRLKNES